MATSAQRKTDDPVATAADRAPKARFDAATDISQHDIAHRIRSEFLEMPGQRLTRDQAKRLYGVDEAQCRQALDRLVDARFLCVNPDGTYARAADGADTPRPNPAKADLRSEKSSAKIPA